MSIRRTYKYLIKKSFLFFFLLCGFSVFSQNNPFDLPFPINNALNPFDIDNQRFDLGDPSDLNQNITYDPLTGTYIFSETLGDGLYYRNPSFMTLEEYLEYKREKSMSQDWVEMIEEETEENRAFELPITIGSKAFENFFGSDKITIRPQGNIELALGANSSRYDLSLIHI